jgi:uncharacterized protein (DUF2147 family)
MTTPSFPFALQRPVFDAPTAGGMVIFGRVLSIAWMITLGRNGTPMSRFLVLPMLLLLSLPALAQNSAVGLWQSIDDATGKPRAEIRITQTEGVLTGRIERSLQATPPGAMQLCSLCADDRKDKPLIGMEIIRDMKAAGDAQTWEGGEILDPYKGKIFRLRLQLQENGKKLQVRGYIGPFYRTQTWIRIS